MSGLAELGNLWHTIQAWLFPMWEDELGELDDRHREFVAVCETSPFQTSFKRALTPRTNGGRLFSG